MKLTVIKGFYDKLDKQDDAQKGHHYLIGDAYPRESIETTPERIEELTQGGFLKQEAPKPKKSKPKK